MLANSNPAFLLASHDPELLARVRTAVSASGARVEVYLSAEPALNALTAAHPMELEMMREAAVLTSQVDRLTGVYNRETILSMLVRETDRVQRLKSSLCMILFDIDDFGHWNTRLGAEICDDLLGQIAGRAARLLRSYDLLGRVGKDEFLVGLPGCSEVNAVLLAERMRYEIFSVPFQVNEESIRLSACFGVTSSQGRSPLVVLREAEEALVCAKDAGPETIHCAGDASQSSTSPISFANPGASDQLFAW